MGLCYPDLMMLWNAKQRGVAFTTTATVGHQSLHLHPQEIAAIRKELPEGPESPPASLVEYTFGGYANRLLKDLLQIESFDIVDNSAYEGANIVHDLNTPLPEQYFRRYDAVIDGGSLEHIFNFPVAVANLMRMVKVGGSLFLSNPANNQCGHGFYQFSPELMFRVFSPENGFEVQDVILVEGKYSTFHLTPKRRVYRVADPNGVRKRVQLLSNRPVTMMVEVKRTSDVEPFSAAPQQSDYVAVWSQRDARPDASRGRWKRLLAKLPMPMQARLLGYYFNWQYSFRNKQFFQQL